MNCAKQRMVLKDSQGNVVSRWTDNMTASEDELKAIFPEAKTVTVSAPTESDPCGHMYATVAVLTF